MTLMHVAGMPLPHEKVFESKDALLEYCRQHAEVERNYMFVIRKKPNLLQQQVVPQEQQLQDEGGMQPPPERLFDSKEELVAYCRQHAIQQGYMVSKGSGGNSYKVYLKCDQGSINVSRSLGLRASTSRRRGCPFKVYGSCTKRSKDRWQLIVKHGEHNHGASENMAKHPYARRFTASQVAKFKQMNASNASVREIVAELRKERENIPVKAQDVYNAKARAKREAPHAPRENSVDRVQIALHDLGVGVFIEDPQPPLLPRKRGRPRQAKSKPPAEPSVRRDNRLCGRCKQPGHNARTCSTQGVLTMDNVSAMENGNAVEIGHAVENGHSVENGHAVENGYAVANGSAVEILGAVENVSIRDIAGAVETANAVENASAVERVGGVEHLSAMGNVSDVDNVSAGVMA